MGIKENLRQMVSELPPGVRLLAAVKDRKPDEVLEAIEAGIGLLGENYVQEAEEAYEVIGKKAEWHLIGHLQRNKVKRAVRIFDMIQTVDSFEIAAEIDRRSAQIRKEMPVLIEVNSGRESSKTGVLPDAVEPLAREISKLKNVKLMGLMTIGPGSGKPEDLKPYFRETRELFTKISALNLTNVQMRYLSMGMSASYKIAVEEGANMIRIGTRIFGERKG